MIQKYKPIVTYAKSCHVSSLSRAVSTVDTGAITYKNVSVSRDPHVTTHTQKKPGWNAPGRVGKPRTRTQPHTAHARARGTLGFGCGLRIKPDGLSVSTHAFPRVSRQHRISGGWLVVLRLRIDDLEVLNMPLRPRRDGMVASDKHDIALQQD